MRSSSMSGPDVDRCCPLQVTELLGTEEDDSMATFVMEKLSAHTPAAKVLDELSAVLDEDAEGFVVKLYRMVIFESQKAALGLNDSQQ